MDLIYNSSSSSSSSVSSSDSSSPNSATETVQKYHHQQHRQHHHDGGATVSSATTRIPRSQTETATETGLSGNLKYSTSSTSSSSSPSLSTSFEDGEKDSCCKKKSTSDKLKTHELTSSKSPPMSSSRALLKSKRHAAAAVTNDVADNSDDDGKYDDLKTEKRKRARKISSSSPSSSESSSCSSHKSSSHKHTNASSAPKRKRKIAKLDEAEDVEDTEFGFNPPLAKRQQLSTSTSLTAAAYSSDSSSSLVSTAYPSPDEKNEQTLTTSERCSPSTTIAELPESPVDSPSLSEDRELEESLPIVQYFDGQNDHDDGYVDDHEGEGEVEVKPAVRRSHVLVDVSFTDEASESNDIEDDDEIISETTTSPSISSSTKSGSQHHGECTPGAAMPLPAPNNTNKTNSNNKPKVKSFDAFMAAHYACMSPAIDDDLTEPMRPCPLPALSWANAQDVWKLMCKKDEQAACLRSSSMLEQHPGLQPRMRAILLDWLIEVCEVYKLHRETYYLAMDFLDRYLTVAKKIQKTHLQLIGITCLFVAAKAEEIYPPKICEFAYVTDGACTEVEILQHEKLLLQSLNWQISPVTAMGWLGVYMQLNVNNHTPASLTTIASAAHRSETNDAFIYPQFSGFEFVQTAQLLDLCSLDIGITNFPYSVIAAAAISHTFDRKIAMNCSGLEWHIIQPCARWMEPFFQVVSDASIYLPMNEKEDDQVNTKFGLGHICPNINTDDSHIIQTHTTTMDMFDHVLLLQQQTYTDKMKQEASPGTALLCPEGLLTPPASSRKPLEEVGGEAYYQQKSSNTSSSNPTVVNEEQRHQGTIVQVVVSQSSASTTTTSTSGSTNSISYCNTSICQPPE